MREVKQKYKTKIGIYSTIDVEVMKEFDRVCDKKAINRSKLLENFIKQWIEENK